MPKTTYAAELKAARERAGMTLRYLAAMLDVSTSYLSDVERGRRCPMSADQTSGFARLCDVDPLPLIRLTLKEQRWIKVTENSARLVCEAIGGME